MSGYDMTYHRYGELMLCLRDELCKLETIMPTSFSSSKTVDIVDKINATILTAEGKRNIPSPELYAITIKMVDLYREIAETTGTFDWKNCFRILNEAAGSLMLIMDDSYVTDSSNLSKQFIN